MPCQEVGLWARARRLGWKILETTGVGSVLAKRRRGAFLGLPLGSWLQPPLSGHHPAPSPGTLQPGPGRRDPGALAAHDTYSFRIWRAVASPR